MTDQLNGMRKICEHLGLSESTILKLIRVHKFPARKTKEAGIWISDKKAIDMWREKWLDSDVSSKKIR